MTREEANYLNSGDIVILRGSTHTLWQSETDPDDRNWNLFEATAESAAMLEITNADGAMVSDVLENVTLAIAK